jgi:hypothetical protein
MAPDLAAGACALDAAIHAWDVAVATGQMVFSGALRQRMSDRICGLSSLLGAKRRGEHWC